MTTPTTPRLASHYAVRVAAMPVAVLDGLRFEKSWAVLGELRAIEQDLAEEGRRLADDLYEVIGGAGALKPRLVALRRALYGGRSPNARCWNDEVRAVLPEQLSGSVTGWLERRARAAELAQEIPALLASETATTTERLREAVSTDVFRYGLLQGSAVLDAELTRWLAGPLEAEPPRQVRDRLVKYLARVVAKTSPYSTFMITGMAEWAPSGTPLRPTGTWEWTSVVELNMWLVQRLTTCLLRHPGLAGQVRLRVNPSVVEREGALDFLGPDPAVPLSTVRCNEALTAVLELFQEIPSCPASEVAALLTELAPDAPPGQAWLFVARLIECGVLQPLAPFSDQAADHLEELASWAAPVPELVTAITRLRESVRGYATLTEPQARVERHGAISRDMTAALAAAGAQDLRLPSKNLIHLNAVFTRPVAVCGAQAWQPIVSDLGSLRQVFGLVDPQLAARRALSDLFAAMYGEAEVPWLRYYQDLNRFLNGRDACAGLTPDTLAPLLAGPMTTSPETWRALPYATDVAELIAELTAGVRAVPPGEDGVIRVSPDRLAELTGQWPADVRPVGSLGCYLQLTGDLARGDEPPRAVLNSVTIGHGRGLSRGARMLAQAGGVPSDLGTGEPERPESVLAEFEGTFGSNLNLRLPMAAYALDTPMSTPSRSPGARIPLSDLLVTRDPATGELCLMSGRLGCRVRPTHLGMMSELWLPAPLRHLAEVFGPPSFLMHASYPLFLPRGDPRGGGVRYLPRVDVGRVTVSRATWAFSGSELPQRNKGEHDASFWRRLADWAAEHGLPERFYVRVMNLDDHSWTPDLKSRKPFYVDLANLHLVTLLERAVTAPGDLVVINEALPDLAEAVPYGQSRHVTEFLIEIG
ncbi:lantibiotic dehydratase [Streptosporangium sp. NPDC051023]|uniref:lantibiotic dehydratase n=1 Tax=Streptosporangium sp. NPDC051023 TaxID=3155410 RepID=UPI00344D0C4A